MSVSELSQASAVAVDRISALEAGELDVDLEMLLSLGDGLGVRASAFVLRSEAIAKEAEHED